MLHSLSVAANQLSAKRILSDGALLSAVLGTLVVGSLSYNPEIWHDDYPPDVRAHAGPMSATAKRQRVLVAIPFFGALMSIVLGSTLRLKRQHAGELTFLAAFLHAYGVFMIFNAFDLVVLDYLLVMRLRPRRWVLPGTAGLAGYDDVWFPVVGFLKGLGLGVPLSGLVAWVAMGRWSRSERRGTAAGISDVLRDA